MNQLSVIFTFSVIGALGLGLIVGWFLGRHSKPQQDGAGVQGELRAQIQSLESQLGRAQEDRLTSEKGRAAAEAQVIAVQQRLDEQKAAMAEQIANFKAEMERSVAQMRDSFSALGTEALTKLQPQFLELANATLAKQSEAAKGDLATRQESIATMLRPMEEMLRTYQERLAQSETNQSGAIGDIKRHLEALAMSSNSLSGETMQLRKVLSSGSARGRWGEETMRRVVEASGMSVHCDFIEQAQEGDKKPDMIVSLPGQRKIIVDSKVPDFEFLSALNESDEVKRAESLKVHAEKLRGTIKTLAERDYPAEFEGSLDYVVLFLPAESLFSAALEGDRELIVWAAQRRIMLTTPASLVALLRSVSVSWQQHDQAANAREIAAAAEELYSRVATFVKHFELIRSGLAKATDAYNDAVGSYERSVRPQGEKVVKLGTGTAGKLLAEIEPVVDGLRLPPTAKA